MICKGKIPSKPAYRKPTGWNITAREAAARKRIAEECRKALDEPFTAGCDVVYTLEDYNREIVGQE